MNRTGRHGATTCTSCGTTVHRRMADDQGRCKRCTPAPQEDPHA